MLKLEINGVHANLDEDLKKYVNKKIGGLERFLPRSTRESAHAEVFIKEKKRKAKIEHSCEVIIKLPHETITTEETTINIYAAVDIVETKLKNQLKKYKDKHGVKRMHHRLLSKLRSRGER